MTRFLKNIMNMLALILAGACLFACAPTEDPDPTPPTEGSVKMTAAITKMDEKIEVDVISSEYTSGVHWVITSDNTVFTDKDGERIKRSDLRAGDVVEITYSGQVMMSLPPQIVAITVKRTERGTA